MSVQTVGDISLLPPIYRGVGDAIYNQIYCVKMCVSIIWFALKERTITQYIYSTYL